MTIQQSIPVPSDPSQDAAKAADKAAEVAARVTPMMEQYLEIKAANPGLLLFYRMGDFYELFFEDAEIASKTLGIVLTKRGKHQGLDIPMCGVPVERSEDYLHRLISAGHRVAVCEQTEDPAAARARGNKSVVRRGVVRLVTPGTLTEDTLLDAKANNYLLAIARARGSAGGDRIGLAWIDISTSEFIVTECATGELAATLARINPNEVIVTDALYGDADLGPLLRELPAVTPLTRDFFDSATAERRLCDYFAVATMDGLSAMSRLEATAAAAAVTYIDRTQVGKRPPLSPPAREAAGTTMAIDPATRANLELTRTLAGERRGSLLDAIDGTVTSAGSRLLAQRLAAPLTDSAAIARRLDAISTFVTDTAVRDDIRNVLRAAPDMSRALARLSVGRGGPRDLAGLRDGILAADQALAQLARLEAPPPEIAGIAEALRRPSRDLAREFERALAESLPLIKRDGGFVREGYESALDETRNLRDASRLVVAAMQARYAEDTGIKGLKIRHNNVLGYFVEVTAQHGDKLMAPPLNATFIHRQTLAGQVRFTTSELGEIEARIANAGDRALGLELEIFERLSGDGDRRERGFARRRPWLCAARRRDRAGKACGRRQLCAAGSRRLARICDRRRPASRGRTGAEARRPAVHCQRLRPVAGARTQTWPDLADHRPEHGGQVDLPAPERVDRAAGADRQLRAGGTRAHRHRRSAVLARRRRRRSRPRPLHLHGGDGGDRGHSQPGQRTLAGDPRRDRPRHRDLRRPVDRLGGDRASA